MTENEQFIYESIFSQVFPIDEIKEATLEEVEDNEFDDEISEEWVEETVDTEWEKLLAESKQWSKPTDTERLVKAFDELCKQNIIALHNAGYTTSDGEYEVVEVEKELRRNKIVSDGYCFYHAQDLTRAIDPKKPSLMIAFQKVDNSDDKVTIGVGQKVVEVLKKNGFEVDWNGKATSKILIPKFKWQHVYDEEGRDLLDYDHVVELMTE